MARVLIIDDRPDEVIRQWRESGCESRHELPHVEKFTGVARAALACRTFKPDVIVIGYGLSAYPETGATVVRHLRESCGFTGRVITNSGGSDEQFSRDGVEADAHARRDPRRLAELLQTFFNEEGEES